MTEPTASSPTQDADNGDHGADDHGAAASFTPAAFPAHPAPTPTADTATGGGADTVAGGRGDGGDDGGEGGSRTDDTSVAARQPAEPTDAPEPAEFTGPVGTAERSDEGDEGSETGTREDGAGASGATPPAPAGAPSSEAPSPPSARELIEIREQLASLSGALTALDTLEVITKQLEQLEQLEQLRGQVAELTRLRVRDADIIDRLHADNTRLRNGEIATATAPLISGLLRLHDQMVSLASGDPQSVAGMLRTQLVQLLDVSAGVTAYEPAAGDPFDASKHSGAGRVPTQDPRADNTVARTVRPGFTRSEGTVVRVAEVEVYRHQPARPHTQSSASERPQTAAVGSEQQESR